MISTLDLSVHARRSNDHLDEPTGAASTTKRSRLGTKDYSTFQPGALIKIRLENFVTYTMTEFDLSPSLNMIIGPNGSGKSTFVCAVCLGLAGKPEYIGRSKRVEDFIKNGEDKGKIEITLKNSPNVEGITGVNSSDEVIKITRFLIRGKNKSEYSLNDEQVSENVVKRMTSQLNIQLDNLCQFLSQERVEEFARLKSDRLLIETVRSIDVKLLDVLQSLKEFQSKQIDTRKELDLNKQKLEELKSKREKLTESVRAFQEFEKKKTEIELHNQLLPYLKVKEHRGKLHVYKKESDQAKSNLRSFLKDKKPFSTSKKELERNVNSVAEKFRLKKEALHETKLAFDKQVVLLNTIREDIEKKKQQNDYYRGRTAKLQLSIAKTRQELEVKRDHLASIEVPESHIFDEIAAQRNDLIKLEGSINDAISEIDSKAGTVNHEMRNIERQIEIKSRSLNSTDRIGILDQSADLKEVKDAVMYIRSRPEMQGKVFEPPIMSVSVKNPRFASYLAQCVDYNTCKAFTIINAAAYEQFADDILKRFKVNLRELSDAQLNPPLPIEEVKSLGFDCYLSDFVTGDSRVIEMLCQFSRIHTIPISTKELGNEELRRLTTPDRNGNILFKRIIHGNRVVDIKRSLYGNRQIFSVDSNVKDTKFYQTSVISEEQKARVNADISQLKSKDAERRKVLDGLSKEKSEYKHRLSKNMSESDALAKKAHSLNEIRKSYSLTQTTIKSLESDVKRMNHDSKKDVSQKIQDVQAQISSQMEKQTEALQELVSITGKLKGCQRDLVATEILHFEAQNLDDSMNEVIGFFNQREENLTKEYQTKKQIVKDMRDTPDYQEWMQQIKSYDEETREKLNVYAEDYEKNGNFNLKDVQDMIDKLESEIAMINHDRSAITILSRVEKELKQLQRVLPNQVEELHRIESELKNSLLYLEPKLDEIVSKISTRFSHLFTNVGSAGAVKLDKANLFSEWKVEIMVKFRDNAALKKLDSHTQSGGERAVSTVLYMIALQEFTTAPFRVVDEINQGMDSRNERIIHKSMVENACADNTSQYFLITPKLLTDLYYHEKMRIHCVMAGSWIPNPTEHPQMVHFGETSSYVF